MIDFDSLEKEPAEPLDYVLMDTLANVYLTTKDVVERHVEGDKNTAPQTTQDLFSGSLVALLGYMHDTEFNEKMLSNNSRRAIAAIRKAIDDAEIILEPAQPTHIH